MSDDQLKFLSGLKESLERTLDDKYVRPEELVRVAKSVVDVVRELLEGIRSEVKETEEEFRSENSNILSSLRASSETVEDLIRRHHETENRIKRLDKSVREESQEWTRKEVQSLEKNTRKQLDDLEKLLNERTDLSALVSRISRLEDEGESAELIRNKLELLEGDERLDAKAIKGLEEYLKENPEVRVIATNKPLSSLIDVNISGLATGQSIKWNGTQWVPYTPSAGSGQVNSVVAGTGISVDSTNPAAPIVSSTITQYTNANARSAISLTTTGSSGAAAYNPTTGVLNVPQYAGTTYTAGTGLTLTAGAFSVNTSQNITFLSNLTLNGLIKTSGGTGSLSIATAGTDYQAPITLTTAGSSGATTFVGNTLNVPNYTYTLPTASTSVLGGVKVDGTTITISGGVISAATGGAGTVSSVSVASANGFTGSVANPTSTPAITLATSVTGLIKGDGTALSAATAGTDYQLPYFDRDSTNGYLYPHTLTDKLGIGTNAPQLLLHLKNSTGSQGFVVENTTANGKAIMYLTDNYTSGTNFAEFDLLSSGTGGTNLLSMPNSMVLRTGSGTTNGMYFVVQNSTGSMKWATGGFANGNVRMTLDNSGLTLASLTNGLVKSTSGLLSNATAGTDYEVPLTFSTGLTRTTNTITIDSTVATLTGAQVLTNKDLTSGTNTFPTFNQNTTGSAAKWTTARNLAGNSVDGSANVAFANKFIVQGTTDAGLSGAQFLGALGTGIVKNTTTTGVLSIAVAADFPTLNQNTTGSAATLTTPRTIGILTGDATSAGSSFDGSANNTNALTLATVNSNVGTFSNATITVNAKGLITAASNGSASGTRSVTQTAHGFSVGNYVYLNGATYTLAANTSVATAEVVGIVSAVADANNFTITLIGGYVTGLSGKTAGTVYFLGTAGADTATPPTSTGFVVKPVFIADSTTSGYFINYRGNVLSGGTGQQQAIATKTATYTLTTSDYTILADATTGALTMNLPTAASASGYVFNIKKIDASANTVTIDPNGAEVVDGAATKVISAQYTNVTIQSNGTAWYIL